MSDQKDHLEQSELLDQIKQRQDARLLREARMLPHTGDLTDEQIEWARSRFEKFLEKQEISVDTAAKEIARSRRALQQFVAGEYKGDRSKLARLCATWMEQRVRAGNAGGPLGYITTRVFERAMVLLYQTQGSCSVGVIHGPAGVGKSVACRAAAANLVPGSVLIECNVGHKSAAQLLRHWCRRLKLRHSGSVSDLIARIADELNGTKRLQMFDEAHYLGPTALSAIRDVHKQAGVGVVLVGTIDVDRAVDDAQRFYGQWSRLIALRYDILDEQDHGGTPLFTLDEAIRYAHMRGLRLAGDGAEYLTELACMPGWGGLGSAGMLLDKAQLIAKGAEIREAHLRAADRSGHGRSYMRRLDNRRSGFARSIKVA